MQIEQLIHSTELVLNKCSLLLSRTRGAEFKSSPPYSDTWEPTNLAPLIPRGWGVMAAVLAQPGPHLLRPPNYASPRISRLLALCQGRGVPSSSPTKAGCPLVPCRGRAGLQRGLERDVWKHYLGSLGIRHKGHLTVAWA